MASPPRCRGGSWYAIALAGLLALVVGAGACASPAAAPPVRSTAPGAPGVAPAKAIPAVTSPRAPAVAITSEPAVASAGVAAAGLSAVLMPAVAQRGQAVAVTVQAAADTEAVYVVLPPALRGGSAVFGDGQVITLPDPGHTAVPTGEGLWRFEFRLPWTGDLPADGAYTVTILAQAAGGDTVQTELPVTIQGHLALRTPSPRP